MDTGDQLDTLSRSQLDKALEECNTALSIALENLKTAIAIDSGPESRNQIDRGYFHTLQHKWRCRLSCLSEAARRDPAANNTLALEDLLFPLYVTDALMDHDFYRLLGLLPVKPRANIKRRSMRISPRTAFANATTIITPPSTPSKLAVRTLQRCARIWGFQSYIGFYFFLGTRVCSMCYALERIIEVKEYSPSLEWKSFYSRVAHCSYQRRGIPLDRLSEAPVMTAYPDDVQTKDITNAINQLCPGLVNRKDEGHIEQSDGDESSDDGHSLIDTPRPITRRSFAVKLTHRGPNTQNHVTETLEVHSTDEPQDTPQHANKKRCADKPLRPGMEKKTRRETPPTTPERLNKSDEVQAYEPIEISSNDTTEATQDNNAGLVLPSMDGRLTDRAIDAAFDLVSSLRHDTFYLDSLPVMNHARLYQKLLAHRLICSTRVLAPIHLLEHDHWVLCVLVPRLDGATDSPSIAGVTVQLYDSLPYPDSLDQAMDVLERAAQAVIRDEADAKAAESTAAALFACLRKPRHIITHVVECPRQVNGVDCGIATIVNSLISLSAAHLGAQDGAITDYQFEVRNSTLWRAVLGTLIRSDILDTKVNEIDYPETVSRLLNMVDTVGENNIAGIQPVPVPLSSPGMTLAQKRTSLETVITSYTNELNSVQEELDSYTSTIADLRAIIDILNKARDGANFELLARDMDGISAAVDQLGNLPHLLAQSQAIVPLKSMASSARRRLNRGRRAYRILRELTAKLEEDAARMSDWIGKVETGQPNGLGAG
ncbi:hypothetical protein F4782DRAFT_536003 [Xylaria castorea]|nr:hypothetical protein F4782DRAFT_536003 [Xylaria castorea]